MHKLRFLFCCVVNCFPVVIYAQSQLYLMNMSQSASNGSHQVVWKTNPGVRYELLSSTNLVDWSVMPGYPRLATQYSDALSLFVENSWKARFFKVAEYDEQAPVITSLVPNKGAFAVARFGKISVGLDDVSGVNPSSMSMWVGTNGPYSVTSQEVTFTNGVLTFDAGAQFTFGSYGSVVDVSLIVADLMGNTGTNTWSFTLEVEPVVSGNLFVFGSTEAQRFGQSIGAIPTRILAQQLAGGRTPLASTAPSWEIHSVSTNSIILSYTGTNAPFFNIGDNLANLTPATVDEIFYREIVSISDDSVSKELTLFTSDISLEDLVVEGSLAVSDGSVLLEASANGTIMNAVALDMTVPLPPVGFSLDGAGFKVSTSGCQITVDNVSIEYGKPPSEGWGATVALEFTAEELHWWLTPKLQTALEIKLGKLKRFSAIASGHIEGASVFQTAVLDGFSFDITLFERSWPAIPRVIYLGNIGPLPVYAKIDVLLKMQADLSAQTALQFRYGMRMTQDAAFGVKYSDGDIDWVRVFKDTPPELVPFGVTLNGDVGVGVSMKPSVRVLVYGLAGVETGPSIRSGVSIRSEGTQVSGYLEGSSILELGLAGSYFENWAPQPSLSLELWRDEWKMFPQDAALQITKQPSSLLVRYGEPAYFSCDVSASQQVSYQWYHNNIPLPGENKRTLLLAQCAYTHGGSYHVQVKTQGQSANSDAAALTVTDSDGSGSGYFWDRFEQSTYEGWSYWYYSSYGTTIVETKNGSLHIKRSSANSSGGGRGVERSVNIPVSSSRRVKFDVYPVSSSVRNATGDKNGEYPAKIVLLLDTPDGERELQFAYSEDKVTKPDRSWTTGYQVSKTYVSGWLRGESFRIHDYFPSATRITKIRLHGSGWDFESYIDNIEIL